MRLHRLTCVCVCPIPNTIGLRLRSTASWRASEWAKFGQNDNHNRRCRRLLESQTQCSGNILPTGNASKRASGRALHRLHSSLVAREHAKPAGCLSCSREGTFVELCCCPFSYLVGHLCRQTHDYSDKLGTGAPDNLASEQAVAVSSWFAASGTGRK